jgi:pantothenate kinase-related protein Tda10
VANLLAATGARSRKKTEQYDIPKLDISGPNSAGSRPKTQWKTIHAGLVAFEREKES